MAQYIDKAALVAEIEKLHNSYMCYINNGLISVETFLNKDAVLVHIKNFIDTLEVKEVDLEKELKRLIGNVGQCDRKLAKHFFELGLKAKGE